MYQIPVHEISKSKKAVIALIIANAIWGAASPVFKWSLTNIHPFTLGFLRFFIASYLLLPFVYRKLEINRKYVLTLVSASVIGIFLNISFFFLALPFTASINAPIIASTGPLILVIFSIFYLHERSSKRVINGMVISFIGILLIILRPLLENGLDYSIFGNLLLVGATICSVGNTVIMKKLAPLYSPLTLVFWQFLIGSITFLPLMLFETAKYGFLAGINIHGITGIIFGAILSSAVAFSFFQYALKYMNASETGIFTYLDPITAILIAIPLLHEKITFAFVLGASLVFLGIYIAEKRINYHPFHLLSRMTEGLKEII